MENTKSCKCKTITIIIGHSLWEGPFSQEIRFDMYYEKSFYALALSTSSIDLITCPFRINSLNTLTIIRLSPKRFTVDTQVHI